MSSHSHRTLLPPLDLAPWQPWPNRLILGGGALALLGALVNLREFAHAWLVAFMFCLSLGLGALFLVLVHHLFDAGWSVAIRRFCEHLACLLFPWLAALFVPIALLAPFKLYRWMEMLRLGESDHALHAKSPLFTLPAFYLVSALLFVVWALLTRRLRGWSLRQDETGAVECTRALRTTAAWGVFAFAITLTLAAMLWMKALQHQWFSTMYGVYYFAGSVWMTLATVYVITHVLERQRLIRAVMHEHQYYFLGSLLFAFTVFYAYIHFSQYFIIWNANVPEETFWYYQREQGTWFYVAMVIIFGHFFVPFLTLLRIDVKHTFGIMLPLCGWAWLMHYVDLAFNVKPVLHPAGFPLQWAWLDLACLAFMVGVLTKVFLRDFTRHAPYPQKDPRLCEAMGLLHQPESALSGGVLDEADDELEDYSGGAPETPGGGR